MVRVKICGITNLKDALMAIEAGADGLGFVNVPKSPRFLEANKIREIIDELPPYVSYVLVTHSVSVEEILDAYSHSGADTLQAHAPLTVDEYELLKHYAKKLIANISIKQGVTVPTDDLIERVNEVSEVCDAILFDTKFGDEIGGTGKKFDWAIARRLKELTDKPVIVAGGLVPKNVGDAIKQVEPHGVDVSSGVESKPGQKSKKKVEGFISNAKKAPA